MKELMFPLVGNIFLLTEKKVFTARNIRKTGVYSCVKICGKMFSLVLKLRSKSQVKRH